MGYWPSKIACILNVILQVGWGIIASIIAGQSMAFFESTYSESSLCFNCLFHQFLHYEKAFHNSSFEVSVATLTL